MSTRKKIIILGILTYLLYVVLVYSSFYYQINATNSIIPWGYNKQIFFILISIGLIVLYWLAYKSIKNTKENIKKIVILFSILFSITFIIAPPIGSADVYNYAYRARVKTVYEQNPYLVATENYPDDLFYNFSPKEWNFMTMQYGPLWASVSIGFSKIAGDNFFWNIFLYKLLALLSFFGSAYLINRILKITNPGKSLQGALLYLWNPLILFETINNAHNDILMIFIVLLAVYLVLKKKYIPSLLVLLLSVLLKYITILLVPVFLYFILKNFQKKGDKMKLVLKAGCLAVIIIVLFYFPFWDGIRTFNGIFQQSQIFSFLNFSLLPGFVFGISYVVGSNYSWSYDTLSMISRNVGLVTFVLFYIYQHSKMLITRNIDLIFYVFLILLSYILLAVTYLQPWYFIWLIPLAVLMDRKYFPHFIAISSVVGLISYAFLVTSLVYMLTFIIVVFIAIISRKDLFSNFINAQPIDKHTQINK
ncbi:MAG: hypothetical protein WCW66_05515 [Patescibacteria group bacterium]|jgi:hypothetical protein